MVGAYAEVLIWVGGMRGGCDISGGGSMAGAAFVVTLAGSSGTSDSMKKVSSGLKHYVKRKI